MRVITGTARGMRLKELPGLETRPTTDKVKESVFNIVQFDVEGRRVLDLFGGTGQMGIEALSRGAASCTFVDVRKEAAAVIRANLAHTKLEEQGKVVQGDYLAFLTGCRAKVRRRAPFRSWPPPMPRGGITATARSRSRCTTVRSDGLCDS